METAFASHDPNEIELIVREFADAASRRRLRHFLNASIGEERIASKSCHSGILLQPTRCEWAVVAPARLR